MAGDRFLDLGDALHQSAVDDVAAMLAGAGPDVDDPVGFPDGLLVVLDHQHRVAEVAKTQQGVDESTVITLMQPDRRLVEHVEGTDQAGTDLAGETDALRLAAGQGRRVPRQAEIVETDVEKKSEAGVDLLRDPLGDQPVALTELERREELGRLADRHVAHLGDVEVVDGDGERGRLESRPTARSARHFAHVPLVLLARPVALGARPTPVEPWDHTFVRRRVLAHAPVAILVLHLEVAVDTMQHDLLLLRRERAIRRVEIELVHLGHRFQHAREVLRIGCPPRRNGAAVDRLIWIGNHQFGVDLERRAQSVARLACTVRRVEREVAWSRLVVAGPALRAGQVLAEGEHLALAFGLDQLDLGHTFGEF